MKYFAVETTDIYIRSIALYQPRRRNDYEADSDDDDDVRAESSAGTENLDAKTKETAESEHTETSPYATVRARNGGTNGASSAVINTGVRIGSDIGRTDAEVHSYRTQKEDWLVGVALPGASYTYTLLHSTSKEYVYVYVHAFLFTINFRQKFLFCFV